MLKVLMTHPTQSMMGLLFLIAILLAGLYFTSLFQETRNHQSSFATERQADSAGSLGLQDKNSAKYSD